MPCYRCGVRQTDPERGKSPWRRGVRRDQLVLVCPGCQESADWTADLESCGKCGSVRLIRRLGQVECLDCGLVREPAPALVPAPATWVGGDDALAEEVGRALDRLLRRR
jgi:ribosomal protein L32